MMKYLLCIICLALPAYLIRFSIFGIPTTLLELLIYAVFLIGLINWKNRQKISAIHIWPAILMLLAGLISVYIAPDKTVALGQFKALFIDSIMVFWLVISYLKKEDFAWVFTGLVGSSLIVAGYSIFQKIVGQVTVDNRVIGIFGYTPNYPALFLAPLAIMFMVHSVELIIEKVSTTNKLLKIYTGFFVGILGLFAIYFSGSRGAMLAVLGGFVFYLIVRFWPVIQARLWLKIIIGLIIIISMVSAWFVFKPNFLLNPAAGGRVTSSNNIRAEIWMTSFELGKMHPVLGLGLGNYQAAFSELTKNRVNFPEYISPFALSSHNIFLMFWLTTGLFGLISFVWLLVLFFQIGLRNINSPIRLVLMSAAVVIILQGLVDTPYFKNDLSLLFWLIIGYMLLLEEQE